MSLPFIALPPISLILSGLQADPLPDNLDPALIPGRQFGSRPVITEHHHHHHGSFLYKERVLGQNNSQCLTMTSYYLK